MFSEAFYFVCLSLLLSKTDLFQLILSANNSTPLTAKIININQENQRMMNFRTLLLPVLIATISITGCQTTTTTHHSNSTEDGIRQVNNVQWDKSGNAFEIPDEGSLQNNQSRIVLFQLSDIDSDSLKAVNAFTRSVVVGINNQFQVSLQPNHFSEVTVCSGQVNLSVESTGYDTNELANANIQNNLQPKHTYYYLVTAATDNELPTIKAVDADKAVELLQGSAEQTHQISRVTTDNCQSPEVNNQSNQTQPVTSPEVQVNTPITLDVFFDFDSFQLRGTAHSKLKAVAEFMQQDPEATVLLESHTDSKGAASYNLKLSEKRGNSVKNALTNQYAIDSHRIATKAYGESQPIDTNDTAQGRQNNRRVVATITP